MRQAFASASPRRVSLMYLDGRPPFSGDDMASSWQVRTSRWRYAAQVRGRRPVMVVTTLRSCGRHRESAGRAHPAGRPRLPQAPKAEPAVLPAPDAAAGGAVQALGAGSLRTSRTLSTAPPSARSASAWAAGDRHCNDKRLAFALAFPFVQPLSLEAVNSTALQNGRGPVHHPRRRNAGHDAQPSNAAHDCRRVRRRAQHGAREGLAALVGGAFACRAVARQLVAFVPALGWAVKAAIGYGHRRGARGHRNTDGPRWASSPTPWLRRATGGTGRREARCRRRGRRGEAVDRARPRRARGTGGRRVRDAALTRCFRQVR
ncbi:MAG: hypothetical protein ACLSGS_04270 [Adlercreutzia sp.]